MLHLFDVPSGTRQAEKMSHPLNDKFHFKSSSWNRRTEQAYLHHTINVIDLAIRKLWTRKKAEKEGGVREWVRDKRNTQMQTMIMSVLSAVRTAETNHVNVVLMAHILVCMATAAVAVAVAITTIATVCSHCVVISFPRTALLFSIIFFCCCCCWYTIHVECEWWWVILLLLAFLLLGFFPFKKIKTLQKQRFKS